MNGQDLKSLWAAAQGQGLLPADAGQPQAEGGRPWPVVLLTALGAWLVGLMMLVLLVLLLERALRDGGSLLPGLLLLGGSVLLLRRGEEGSGLFVQQLALAGLTAATVLIAYGMSEGLHLPAALIMFILSALSTALAGWLPQAWLRVLLGGLAAGLFLGGLSSGAGRHVFLWSRHGGPGWLFHLHLLLLLWLAALGLQAKLCLGAAWARAAAALESFAAGWLLIGLLGLALVSGMTFLLPAQTGLGLATELQGWVFGREMAALGGWLWPAISALLALAAGAWVWRCWPSVRQAWCVGVALALAVLAGFNPLLGVGLLVLALCATGQRWRLAAAAGLSCAWMLGAFYYQLTWPLASKALLLLGVAAALAGMARWAVARAPAAPVAPGSVAPILGRPRTLLLGLSVLATLLLANGGIWQKEQLIAHGRAIFVPLAPVDPRSLMQGDYMALNFGWPAPNASRQELLDQHRLVLKLDPQGLALSQREDDGRPLAADELALQLVQKNGRWILVTDAFFFKEGEAQRYAQARFGEFRVDAAGKALLVGLRGEGLAAL